MANSIIVPTAGIGVRVLKSPKALIELEDGSKVIERQYEIIRSVYPDSELIFITGFKSEKVEQVLKGKKAKVVKNNYFYRTNVSQSIDLGIKTAKNNNILVIYGDLVFNKELLSNLPFNSGSFVLVDNKGFMRKDEVGVNVQQNKVNNMSYGLETKWSQCFYMNSKESALFVKCCENQKSYNKFGFEIINSIIENNGSFYAFEQKDNIVYEIDSYKDLKKINENIINLT